MTTQIKLINDKDLGTVFEISTTKGDTLGFFNSPGIAFTASDVDGDGVKTPMNLTGTSIKSHLRKSINSNVAEMEFDSAGNSIDISDLVNGNFVLNKTAAEMNALKPGCYIFDIQFTKGTDVSTWTRGYWNHAMDITI